MNASKNISKKIALFLAALALVQVLLVPFSYATDFSSTNFILRDPVLTPAGGGTGTSTNFQQIGATGQPAIGESASTNFTLRSGFGYFPGTNTLTQTTYRWYDNIDAIQPVIPRAAESTPLTSLSVNSNLRLRVAIKSEGEIYPSAKFFKLYFAPLGSASSCGGVASSKYEEVGPIGSVKTWIGYDNLSVASGAQISANLLSTAASGSRETYEESPLTSATAATPLVIATGVNADAEWDWSLKLQGAQDGSIYCFRMALSDGTLLSAYSNYPQAGLSGSGSSSGSSGGGGGGGGGAYRDSSLGTTPSATQATTQVVTQQVTTTATTGKTELMFTGKAYPGSKLTLLKDGAATGSFTAGTNGDFTINISNVADGKYNFNLYAEDAKGLKSASFAQIVEVVKDKSTKIENVIIAPTLRANKLKVKYGEALLFSGQAYPLAKVKLIVGAKNKITIQKQADKNGQYAHSFDSSKLAKGDYNVQASAGTSGLSQIVSFGVGNETILVDDKIVLKSDLTGDSQVNLVDFSVMAFWYGKSAPTDKKQLEIFKKIDLNGDNKIDVQDFSVLVANWTG